MTHRDLNGDTFLIGQSNCTARYVLPENKLDPGKLQGGHSLKAIDRDGGVAGQQKETHSVSLNSLLGRQTQRKVSELQWL